MSRQKFMLDVDVVMSDAYCGLTFEARDAYILLNAHSNSGGRIDDPRFYLRGRGHDLELLDELCDAGFVIEVDGEFFLKHFWLNNQKNEKFVAVTKKTRAWQNGRLGFVGEDFKSEFTVLNQSNDNQVRDWDGTCARQAQTNAMQSNANAKQPNSMAIVGAGQVQDWDGTCAGQMQNDHTPNLNSAESMELNTIVNKLKVLGQFDEQETRQYLLGHYAQGGMDAVRDEAHLMLDGLDGSAQSESDLIPF